jgi:predicted nucleic acid-binding protein
MSVFVLDACAVVSLLKNEDGADIVADIYRKANKGEARLFMNRINLYEVFYGFYRDMGQEYALKILNNIEASAVKISELDREIMLEAGRIKAVHKRISVADSIAVAQAVLLKGSLVTSDHHELDAIEGKENLTFTWIRMANS